MEAASLRLRQSRLFSSRCPLQEWNCIGSRNMRNFIMFCLYTSLACLDSLVAGVAYISAVLSVSFANPLAFLTLLPHSISQFFSGALLSSEMFVILMLYLWLGIGLACAGFCCHQMLLILRGQTRYQVRKGMVSLSLYYPAYAFTHNLQLGPPDSLCHHK
ncbi:palmitoyltransferase ZDHHC22 [Alligator mississippiensis]|uniref:Palmitoyltransferase n=1 Tax=Alligator mississippiensis TaxID=8496 RepID=A0A151MLH6_ALLMI|nr:palmitoyltransferase ZDHHC22 [Alligator mississippiensis]